ncbi:hypothetical protein KUCAC02_037396, partial [Chaenocephalus aceratus]
HSGDTQLNGGDTSKLIASIWMKPCDSSLVRKGTHKGSGSTETAAEHKEPVFRLNALSSAGEIISFNFRHSN